MKMARLTDEVMYDEVMLERDDPWY